MVLVDIDACLEELSLTQLDTTTGTTTSGIHINNVNACTNNTKPTTTKTTTTVTIDSPRAVAITSSSSSSSATTPITTTTTSNHESAATPRTSNTSSTPSTSSSMRRSSNPTTATPRTQEVVSSSSTMIAPAATLPVVVVPKTIPLGQRITKTKKRRKLPPAVVGATTTGGGTSTVPSSSSSSSSKLVMVPTTKSVSSSSSSSTTALPNHRQHRIKKPLPVKRRSLSSVSSSPATATTTTIVSKSPQFLPLSLSGHLSANRNDTTLSQQQPPSSSSYDKLATIEELSVTQSDSESVDDDNNNNYNGDPLQLKHPVVIPAIMPIASWEYSSSSGSDSGNDSFINDFTDSPTDVPLTVVKAMDGKKTKIKKHEKGYVMRSLRNSLASMSAPSQQQQEPDADADASTTSSMTPKHSNLSIAVSSLSVTKTPAIPPTIISPLSSLPQHQSQFRHGRNNYTSEDATDSPTTVVMNAIPTVLGVGGYTTNDVDIENNRGKFPECINEIHRRSGHTTTIIDETNPSPSRMGCMRLCSPTAIVLCTIKENISSDNHNTNTNPSSTSSSTSSSSTERLSNNYKWGRVCKIRYLLYALVFILLSCIVILSTSVVLHNNSNGSNSEDTMASNVNVNNKDTTGTNRSHTGPVSAAAPTSAPVQTSNVDRVTTSPTQSPQSQSQQTQSPQSQLPVTQAPQSQQQQTAIPIPVSASQQPTAFPIISPSISTLPPTSLAPMLSVSDTLLPSASPSFGGVGEIKYKRKVPIISINCGGPTLTLITSRQTVNSNNETSAKNTTIIWESDVYYNTNYYFGASKIRSKTNVASCQNYIIPEGTETDAGVMMDSITVLDDRELDTLFCTERFFVDGFGGYEIPVDDVGRYYRIELYMMESYHDEVDERIFDIIIENEIQEMNFDIYEKANGRNKKATSIHTVFVSDSSLSIYFNATVNYPLINAMSIYFLLQE